MPPARTNIASDHDRSDKLETWKAIAAYVGRDVRTVMRWEKDRGLPVHWVPGGGRRAVYAYKREIDAWFNKTCLNKAPSDNTNPLRAQSGQSRPVAPAGPASVGGPSANLPFGFLHLTADRRIPWSAAVIVVLIIWVATLARRTLT